MEKSYAKLVHRARLVTAADAITAAIVSLTRHSSRNVTCSQCGNDDRNRFEVTDIDHVSRSITEVQCSRCKETSYVCHSQCYCRIYPASNGLECSYKKEITTGCVPKCNKSIQICRILESTVSVLRNNIGNRVCSCGNQEPHQTKVICVDRLGFITNLQCYSCEKVLTISPLEVSYIVQTLYHGQTEKVSIFQQAFDGDHDEHMQELCNILQRHSFYNNSICPEYDNGDPESCRVTAIDKETGKVTEVEFVTPGYNQSLKITCHSGCYYDKYPSLTPFQYEVTYKEKIRMLLETTARRSQHIEQSNNTYSGKAILSCTVLSANAAILRRHSKDLTLCQNCKNDDHENLQVVEIDQHGFITRVMCTRCGHSLSTDCHRSPFYYEEIDESVALERGDHICWHRNVSYWHHAIVTRTDDQTVTLAEYASHGFEVSFNESRKNRQDVSPSWSSGIPYRITFEDCYTDEYTALRAEKCIGEKHYNPLSRNCEHSSQWCKTGLSKSDQVVTWFSSVAKPLFAFGLRILSVILIPVYQGMPRSKGEGSKSNCRRVEEFVYGVYLTIVFLLFLVWSLHRECKNLKPANTKWCCNRPPSVACGLSIRIITRELFAVVGPFMAIQYEYCDLYEELWKIRILFSVILLSTSVTSYLLGLVIGTVIGTLLEYISRRCICCVKSCVHRMQRTDDLERRLLTCEDPEINQERNVCTESSLCGGETSCLLANQR